MNKIWIILLFIVLTIGMNAQEITDNPAELQKELNKIQNELNSLRKDVNVLKDKTAWINFKLSGSVKTIWGANIWARLNPDYNSETQTPYFNTNTPITNGFDFINTIRFQMLLSNTFVGKSLETGDKGTEVSVELAIESKGISELKPVGSYYVVSAKDDQGNIKDIYLPRYERAGSNVVFGAFEIAVKEAIVRNILGSGFFVSFKDVQQVHQYYGTTGLAEILKLNNDYFNNGFVLDSSDDRQYASLYYAFDSTYYEPESEVAEAMKMWSDEVLYTDPLNPKTNQKPHGISAGYDKNLSDNVNLKIELGVASKDAFDPRYFTDNEIDYGFFLNGGINFFSDNFNFYPKLAASFAFQYDTTSDLNWTTSAFGAACSFPLSFNLPTGKNDRISFELDWNLNLMVAAPYHMATILSFIPELVVLDNKLSFSLPVIYSFKNAGYSGFQAIGHDDVKWVQQIYDDHILNLGFKVGFNSQNLFGDIFQYNVVNSVYYAFIQQYHPNYSYYPELKPGDFEAGEYYFYDILTNDFILNDIGVNKLVFYLNNGVGYVQNARLIDQATTDKYKFDKDKSIWVDKTTGLPLEWKRWAEAIVYNFETGFYIDIFKNFTVGFSASSPKLHLGPDIKNPTGNQQSFGLFKIWTELKF